MHLQSKDSILIVLIRKPRGYRSYVQHSADVEQSRDIKCEPKTPGPPAISAPSSLHEQTLLFGHHTGTDPHCPAEYSVQKMKLPALLKGTGNRALECGVVGLVGTKSPLTPGQEWLEGQTIQSLSQLELGQIF